jgi:hypothetical protein
MTLVYMGTSVIASLGVLEFKLLQALQLLDIQPAKLLTPAIEESHVTL